MDVVQTCLSLVPVPYLSVAFSSFRFIWTTVDQVQASKQQLRALAQCIAQLLQTLDNEYRIGHLEGAKTSMPLENLRRLLDDVSKFIQKQTACAFLKLIFTKDERIATIEEYHRRVWAAVNSFQISALMDIQHWQSTNDSARAEDQQLLNDRLSSLEANQNRLIEALDAQQSNMMAVMVTLQRHLDRRSSDSREHQFLSHSIRFLSTVSGSQVQMEDWMITSFEVDFGPEIGSGGFGRVYKGTWHKMEVALKILRSDSGATPSSKSIHREIVTWSKIRHPHILQFLGANILDEKPFIVMPYLKNGNARDYIRDHPDCNRLKILHHVSLGLVYLHSQNVIHGDLKALNVLIDDSEKALLCDFGLSRVKADATSRTAVIGGSTTAGTRNWMAPEQLMGSSLRKPCDIYAFGMTIFEIYADDIPLGHLGYNDFFELVVRQNVRPQRPEPDEAPGLSDEVWKLAEECWVKEPPQRPNANTVCDSISHLLDISAHTDPIPSLPIPPPQPPSPLLPVPAPVPDFPPLLPADRTPPTLVNTNLMQRHDDTFFPGTRANWVDDTLYVPPLSVNPFPAQSTHDKQPLPTVPRLIHNPVQKSKLKMVDWARLSPTHRTIHHTACVNSAVFSPDGQSIVSGSDEMTLQVWDVKTGKYTSGLFKGHTGIVWSVAVSPNSQLIASGSQDSTVRVWDKGTGKCILMPAEGHTKAVRSVAFSPDGKWIASGSYDETIRLLDVRTGRYASSLFQGHTADINSIAFSPDGQRIVSGSDDQTVRVWGVNTGSSVSPPFKGHTSLVRSVAFSPDGQRIVSGSDDRSIRVWDAKTGECVSGPFQGHADSVRSVTFSPDGRWVASGSRDKTVRIWHLTTGLEGASGPFEGHTNIVWSVAFSPDGQSIASGSEDKTICIWTPK